jgi:hypothetical protein
MVPTPAFHWKEEFPMSLMSTANLAAERDAAAPPRRRHQTGSAATASSSVGGSKAEVLVGFIPGEALTAYLAVGSAIAATATTEQPKLGLRWAMFALFALLTPVAAYAMWRAKLPASQAARRRAPWLEMMAATVAFLVWATSLPTAPLAEWRLYDPAYPVIAVVVGGLLLALVTPFAKRQAIPRTRRAGRTKPRDEGLHATRGGIRPSSDSGSTHASPDTTVQTTGPTSSTTADSARS